MNRPTYRSTKKQRGTIPYKYATWAARNIGTDLAMDAGLVNDIDTWVGRFTRTSGKRVAWPVEIAQLAGESR